MAPVSPLTGSPAAQVAVVGDPDAPHGVPLRACLRAAGPGDATWYAPRDVDHLEAAVLAGTVRVVVWATPAELLAPVWDGAVAPETWLRPDLTLCFADGSDPVQVRALLAAWQSAERRRRRGQLVGGLVLSACAILSAFVLLLLAR